uniref:Integrator complex subunit 4 n=1 Tax=Clastoptera arizonana TaxID=38151 RepID=A0A1B6E309_9HEMI
MAAVLKKRALAEYSQVTQEPAVKPFKRLRIVKKKWKDNSTAVYIDLLNKCKTSNEALQYLLRICESLHIEEEDMASAFKALTEHFLLQSDLDARVIILKLFSEIASEPGADVQGTIDETVQLLKMETSRRVKAQGLTTLIKLSKLIPENVVLVNKLIQVAKQHLTDKRHTVKKKCLDLIGELLPLSGVSETSIQSTIRLVADFSQSQDSRVRAAAFKTLVVLHGRGFKLPATLYSEACEALTDDYETVRSAAIQLLWLLSNSFPDNLLKINGTENEIRMIDDAFSKICNAVNDLSMNIRKQSAQLLGTMSMVSPKFLHQTLDKKLFSNMKKKKTAHERAWDNVTSGEWASGNKWADDAPREVLDADQINLMSSGACGAFVHGLEDEFLEVRSAAVDSICLLSLSNAQFAKLALDFLVDMFNDEIEDVRLKAIDSLTRMSQHIVLREDQLETILGALEDFSMDVREGLHRMLAACTLSTKGCLQMCVESLLDNLKKYPQDRKSTWGCLKKIGSRHPELTLPLVPELLAIHPFFDTPEPDVEDPAYICILILVFNAAQHCPTMLQLFEETTVKHYGYLRDTMPNFVPPLKLGSQISMEFKVLPASTPIFLNTLMSRLEGAPNINVLTELLVAAEKDLTRLASIDSAVSGAAQFTALFISSQLLMTNILANSVWCSNATTKLQGNFVKNSIQQLLQHCLKMQYLFTGRKVSDVGVIKQFKLKTLALQFIHLVRSSNTPTITVCQHFLIQVEETQKYLNENGLLPDTFTSSVIKEMTALDDSNPEVVAAALMPLLQNSSPTIPPRPHTDVRMCYATISLPSTSADSALKFTAGLIMGIPVEAEIFNLRATNTLRLKVKYPDQQTQLIEARRKDLRLLPGGSESSSASDYRMLTTVLVSHQVWTEALYIEVSLVMDLTEQEAGIALTSNANHRYSYIDLCKPVKVYICPKPVKRGI